MCELPTVLQRQQVPVLICTNNQVLPGSNIISGYKIDLFMVSVRYDVFVVVDEGLKQGK